MNSNATGRYQYPDGNVNMNSVAHLTGTFAAALVQRVWEHSGHGESAVYNLFERLERLNNEGREAEVMELLKLVCGIVGHAFPCEIDRATQSPPVRTGFILSFLSDYDDTLLDLEV